MFQSTNANTTSSTVGEELEAVNEKVQDVLRIGQEVIEERDWTAVLDSWEFKLAAALVGGFVLIWLWRRIRRFVMRRRPAKFNPVLQKYSGQADPRQAVLSAARHKQAALIVATSSASTIKGYELIEQIEAVYVDGFTRPEEAMEGLKSAAALKGANALVNVSQQRQSANDCSAQGDAVVVQREGYEETEADPSQTESDIADRPINLDTGGPPDATDGNP